LTLAGETSSFTKWVGKLRFHPLFTVLSGFEGRTPGVGTFYDFAARLFPERPDPIVRKPISKPKDSDQEKHQNRPLRPGIVQQLVTKALDNKDQPLPAFPALGLNLLLKPIVLRSNDLTAALFLQQHRVGRRRHQIQNRCPPGRAQTLRLPQAG